MTKWVDNEVYFGPDRRRGGLGKRWGDRRRYNDAGEPPPLGAVLRRLRVLVMHLSTLEERRKALQLANLAMTEAEKLRLLECADSIRVASEMILAGDSNAADRLLMQAQALSR